MAIFVDECGLNVRGGDGGAGCISFRREGPVSHGGPNGGDGGRGGEVWLVADRNVASLLAFRDHPHRRATSGAHGRGKDLHGKRGTDLEIHVPEGTVVYELHGNVALADLARHGDRFLAAAGGRGGRGNAKFLKNKRRAPSFAEQGEAGEERWLRLELKLMADVALVGFPNAGKSTFISRISAAKPKIADYPFTTLIPHLGVVRVGDDGEFVVADIPGLIEGASEGKGLGLQFLRHIERARVLCLLLDLAPMEDASPQEQERILLHELESYRPELLDRPRLVVGTKVDVAGHDHTEYPELRMSAVNGDGVMDVVFRLGALVADTRAAEPEPEGFVVIRPEVEGVTVSRESEHEFRVLGRQAERAVALSDVSDRQALDYIDERMKRLGVAKALARAGAQSGDVVHIGEFSFEYEPD
ncbi:MAG TPA: GTPase ObgE [Acidimicrobiales bacterium]